VPYGGFEHLPQVNDLLVHRVSSRGLSPLEHDPEKWKPVFPRDKREAFARRSCSNNKMTDEHDSTQLKHALVSAPSLKYSDKYPGRLIRGQRVDGAIALTLGSLRSQGRLVDMRYGARSITRAENH
jgi:hypothetical protein